jgi:hypothetical protein
MTKVHSPYGGSQVYRYTKCPGSVKLAEGLPNRTSKYAEEGTFAHVLGQTCLEAGFVPAKEYVGKTVTILEVGSSKDVTEEMAQAVQVYVDAVAEDFDEEHCEILVEQRFAVKVDALDEPVPGTNDCLVYNRAKKKLTIYDYKHGAGMIVDVEDNGQCKFYTIGALQSNSDWEVAEVEFVIVQPRAVNAGETLGVHRWNLPLYELLDFPDELNDAITQAEGPDPRFEAGSWCTFCPAATICTVRERAFIQEAALDVSSIEFIGPDSLPELEDFEHMGRVIEAYEKLGGWVNQLRQRMDEHLLAGGEIPGWKVVEKVARRKLVAEGEEVAAYLQIAYEVPSELTYPRKVETVTEIKRLMKSFIPKQDYAEAEKDFTLRFTIKEASGLTTAPSSDKRPAIAPIAAEFGSVQLGTED